MTDPPPPCFRKGRSARRLAWAFGATIVALACVMVVADGASGLPSAAVCIGVVIAVAVVVRIEVCATPAALVISDGWRTRHIPWSQIEGFRVEEGGGQRRVLVLVDSGQAVVLPIANGGVLLTRQREASAIREALEDYRLTRA